MAENEMIAAFCSAQPLGQLLYLHAEMYSYHGRIAQCFLVWLLKCVPNLLALNLGNMQCPPASLSFQSLRHLQVGGENLPRTFQPARQLPVLQTLCISGLHPELQLQEVNLLGCQQLSKLVMKGFGTQHLLLEPACQCGADLDGLSEECDLPRIDLEMIWRASFESYLCSVCELSVCCHVLPPEDPFYTCPDRKGIFAGLPRLAVLKVDWPAWVDLEMDEYEPKRDMFEFGAERLLTDCLASDGPPVLSLRVIIITAVSMQARIPGHLPNLEQLVILADGCAELSFANPEATILALKKFHAFGQPLKPDGLDAVRMSLVLAGTGRALGAAVAQTAGMGFEAGSSCVYLRPAAAEALPIQRLYDLVAGLAQGCKCGACFDCLSKAGRLDF